MRAADSETTGLDTNHSARPFFFTICDEDFNIKFWEWFVNPLTRMPEIPEEDLQEIRDEINSEQDSWVGQNFKFDVKALDTIGVFNESCQWDWSLVNDTLIAGHLLASNQSHDLTTMALMYLGVNIKPYEEHLQAAVNEARRYARSHYPKWKIAKKGLEGMPSAKEAVWQYDMWLPRAIAKEEGYPESHPWWTVLAEYSNADSSVTLPLMKVQLEKIKARGLEKIYAERLKLLPIAYQMEKQGIPANKNRAAELKRVYQQSASQAENICINVSEGKLTELPEGGNSNALRDVIFDHFKLVSPKKTPKGGASLDKFVLDGWAGTDEVPGTLARNTKAYIFIKNLLEYRKRKTGLGYLDSYENFWIPIEGQTGEWAQLYPSMNCTGTHTLRWSSQNPNFQQCSKLPFEVEDEFGELKKYSSRYMFGPLPGEEWWSLDAQNIERRIPAYEAREEEIIALFERPNDPPYFGSEHSLVAHILWPKEFNICGDGKKFKEKYKATLYQWTKNFNFACQYQCQEKKGDETAHQKGAYQKVKSRFRKQTELNNYWVNFANHNGYVETIPDKSIDPTKGYPIQVEKSQWGKVSPTTPLSFHVQGTAMAWMNRAMVRVYEFLAEFNRSEKLFKQIMGRYSTTRERQIGYKLIAQVHDELNYSFPQGRGKEPWRTNKPLADELARIMALGGADIDVPTPVGISYHPNNWGEEIVL